MDMNAILFIPFTAIVIGGLVKITQLVSDHFQEIARIKRSPSSTQASVSNDGLEALRTEIMKLRDTTTQYDMSVERTMADLRQRMAHMESRMQIEVTPSDSRPSPEIAFAQPAYSDQHKDEQVVQLGRSGESS